MKTFLLFSLPFIFTALPEPQSLRPQEATSTGIPSEYINWELLKINNQLPLLCQKQDLIKLLGKPDSAITPNMDDICVSYFDTTFSYLYYGDSQFESVGDKAVISSISFDSRNRIRLHAGALVFDHSLTLEKLSARFPRAVKEAEILEIDKKGKVLSVKLATSKKETDDAWFLFFKNGRLVQMDYWMQC